MNEVTIVDTIIIPDRNAGIGSLLWDLQNSQYPGRDGPPLLGPEFAFIDLGVSHAKVSTTLKTLLARDLRMNVEYVATERLEVVPYAYGTLLGARAEKIRSYLSGMITTRENAREVTDWHYVVDLKGKLSSVAYSYIQQGNEVWESYYMGRTFMISGKKVEYLDPTLDEMLATDVLKIEAMIALERKRDRYSGQPGPTLEGYRIENNPLEAGLAEFGISLQKTDIPLRVKERQNVLFLGNVLNHYPQDEQASELERIAANMQDKDIIIVQVDGEMMSFIEVFQIKVQGNLKTRELVMWINTITLEIRKHDRGAESWRIIHLKPELGRIVSRLIDCLERKAISPEWAQKEHKILIRQYINQVFGTFFRALPVEETLRIAIREALRRLPSMGGLKGIPVFKNDSNDAFGGALGLDPTPIVSEEDFINMMLAPENVERTPADNL